MINACKWLILLSLVLIFSIFADAKDEIKVDSTVESISLFKNGLGVVIRTINIPGPGKYLIEDVPEPLHGTFWIESNVRLTTKLTMRKIQVDEINPNMSLDESFAGKDVIIHLKGEPPRRLHGKILKYELSGPKWQWNRTYQQQNYYNYRLQQRDNFQVSNPGKASRFLTLQTKTGIIYFDSSLITYIECDSINRTVSRYKPVLVFHVVEVPSGGVKIKINYLTKGISWAPSYRIDLKNSKNLTIQQKAVIKNEFTDFKSTKIRLISGFPNIKFAHVTSPFSLQTNWSQFFQQLNNRPAPGHAATLNVVSQQAIMTPSASPLVSGLDFSADTNKGVDIHYHPIGEISMKEGDSMAITVDNKTTTYDRVVEWIAPQNFDEWGRFLKYYERRNNPEKYENKVWDSIRFKNPFDFPMTTGAASLYKTDKFLGQNLSTWVNPGEETIQHITKALSIKVKNTGREVKSERKVVWLGNDDYQKCFVEGTLFMKNHRNSVVKMLIRKRFYGELISAEAKPTCELCESGVYSVNELNQLTWEVLLKPEEEKSIKYKFSILANI